MRLPGWLGLGFLTLAAGWVHAQTPSPAPQTTDAVGDDVSAAARQWASGDLAARNTLMALANAGRADAQEAVGEILMAGVAGAPDRFTACGYFAEAAKSRRDALHSLAVCTEMGVGGTPNLTRAAALYKEAADQGYAKSMCALGNLYVTGRGVPKDPVHGASLCLMGAQAGNADAQTDVGNLYLQGVGVPRDLAKARSWYEKAAESGQPNAEFTLGIIYWNGAGVTADHDKAAAFWRSAYGHGRVDAALPLAAGAMARWNAGHAQGDTSALDEAIGWYREAIKTAPEAKRPEIQTQLASALAMKDAEAKRAQ
jgi:TPR repeat protein